MQKFDILQAPFKVAAAGGIFFFWTRIPIGAFKLFWHIILTSPEKESFEAVCENCPEHYDDDEYHLIHGTHLCEACR